MEARYRQDYAGEFVVLETTWNEGKRTEKRDWIENPITNTHISGRAACIGSVFDRENFDYTILQKHRGGLLGSLKLQTYGVGAIAKEMRLDFAVETNTTVVNQLLDAKYQENNILYTTARICIAHPGEFYLIPQKPHLCDAAQILYLAAFDGHKEIFMIGYNKESAVGSLNWIQEVKAVIRAYPGVKFYIVGEETNMPDAWLDLPNTISLKLRDFIGYCDV
jgi:hypothetical protein